MESITNDYINNECKILDILQQIQVRMQIKQSDRTEKQIIKLDNLLHELKTLLNLLNNKTEY